jgi:hypothetical protein
MIMMTLLLRIVLFSPVGLDPWSDTLGVRENGSCQRDAHRPVPKPAS